MERTIREHSLIIEIEILKEKLNKELKNTNLSNDYILHMSQELDILITQYTKGK